eukprot:10227451-Heterocapsa_arctica.AAC.1
MTEPLGCTTDRGGRTTGRDGRQAGAKRGSGVNQKSEDEQEAAAKVRRGRVQREDQGAAQCRGSVAAYAVREGDGAVREE